MKTSTYKVFLIASLITIFCVAISEAGTRVINTSSGRGSRTPKEVIKEEESKSPPPTINKTFSGNSPRVSETRGRSGNVNQSGNVRIIKKTEEKSEKRNNITTGRSVSNTRERTIHRTPVKETSPQIKTHTTTEKKTVTTTPTVTKKFPDKHRTVSTGYKTRNEADNVKVYKISDDKKDYTKDRSFSKTSIANHKGRSYHSNKIGNVHEGGNVNTRYDKFSRDSHKATFVKRHPSTVVRDSRHIIRRDDRRVVRPREYPNRYHYFWSGNWHRFPVARGHYPRYFYYWRDNAWSRVDRVIVYNTWVYNDYYNYDHVFVTDRMVVPEITYPEYTYQDFITKGETEENLIVKTLVLSQSEVERTELLLEAEIIQNILASVAPDEENSDETEFEYDDENGMLIVTAPEELVLKIQTIVQDERAFEAFYNGSGENAVDVISVVNPIFLEKDYNEAVRLGSANFSEISKFLKSLDTFYASSGKKCFYNDAIGTITVIESEENLYRAWHYMNKLPYIPKEILY